MAVTDYSGNLDLEIEDDPNEAGGSIVSLPGWYHLKVKSIIENDQLEVKTSVLASTNPNQEKNVFNDWINLPDGSNKDGGKFAFKVLVRLARALNLKNCHTQKPCLQMKPGDHFAVDWDEAANKEFVVKIRSRSYVDGGGKKKEKLEIEGLQMFHVSDSEVKEAGLKLAKSSSTQSASKPTEKPAGKESKPDRAPAETESSSLDDLI